MDLDEAENKGNPPLVPQTETKTETNCNTKAEAKPKDNIYSRIKFRCEECNEEFRNKIALTTHSLS